MTLKAAEVQSAWVSGLPLHFDDKAERNCPMETKDPMTPPRSTAQTFCPTSPLILKLNSVQSLAPELIAKMARPRSCAEKCALKTHSVISALRPFDRSSASFKVCSSSKLNVFRNSSSWTCNGAAGSSLVKLSLRLLNLVGSVIFLNSLKRRETSTPISRASFKVARGQTACMFAADTAIFAKAETKPEESAAQ